jgi:hypothetical protein
MHKQVEHPPVGQRQTIDYSALSNYPLRKVLPQALKQTFRSKRYKILNLVWTIMLIPNVIASLVDPRADQESILNAFVYYLIFFGIWMFYYTYRLHRDQLEAFAAVNGWTLRKYKYGEPLPGSLAGQSYKTDVSRVLEATVETIRWDIFCMHQPQQNLQRFTIFRSALTKDVPGMILDSTRTRGRLSIPKDWQRVELEGDFYKNFILHIRKKTHVGVLSYMAPDLMQILDNNHRLHDIQVDHGYLYVLCSGDARDADSLQRILPTLADVYHKIN